MPESSPSRILIAGWREGERVRGKPVSWTPGLLGGHPSLSAFVTESVKVSFGPPGPLDARGVKLNKREKRRKQRSKVSRRPQVKHWERDKQNEVTVLARDETDTRLQIGRRSRTRTIRTIREREREKHMRASATAHAEE